MGFALPEDGRSSPMFSESGVDAMIKSRMHMLYFANNEHLEFYNEQVKKLNPDCYLKPLIYTLGLSHDTRRRFDSLYDAEDETIVPEAIHSAWQTSNSLKVTRLAFQLFTETTPSAFLCHGTPDFDECARYSVSNIFCCAYAPYFAEAIKLRYPEYMGRREM
jgi:hypothetical protein